jgi:hypothetical protein
MPEPDYMRSPNTTNSIISDSSGVYSVENGYIYYNGLKLEDCPEVNENSVINKIGSDIWFTDKEKNITKYSLRSRKVSSTESTEYANAYKSLCHTYYISGGCLYKDSEEMFTSVTNHQLVYNTLVVKTPSYVYLINLSDDSYMPVVNRGFELLKSSKSDIYDVYVNKHKVTSIVL